jgi:transposase
MIILKRETGGLAPQVQGNGGGHGKLEAVKASIGKRMTETPDLTLDDLVTELAEHHGITIHRVSVWRLLRGLGLTHKKRPASRREEAARGSPCAPDMDHAAPALHAQPIAALGVH